MTIANCPSCQEEVRVPGSTSKQATLECPWCGYQAVMTEFLKSSLLLVVNDPVVSDDRGLAFAIETEKREDTPRFEFEERDAPQVEPMSQVTPAASRRPRPSAQRRWSDFRRGHHFGGAVCFAPRPTLPVVDFRARPDRNRSKGSFIRGLSGPFEVSDQP